uniref:DUF3456 domain-containing protein n=1 Tax=Strongyloides venezuelensis TaxID=75913 RepID=A0A0K0F3C1_STRVS
MKILFIVFLLVNIISGTTGDVSEIEATNYQCDICNLIIREAFYQQYLARRETFDLQTQGFHATEEKILNYQQIDAVKSDMYLEDLMSFVCGKTYFYGLAKDTNTTTDYYTYLPKESLGGRYEFVRNSTIQFQNDCLEMVDDFREELIRFFKKDHIFPVMEWCHIEKGFCSKDEAIDMKAYAFKEDDKHPEGGEMVEIKLKEEAKEGSGEEKDKSKDQTKEDEILTEENVKSEL